MLRGLVVPVRLENGDVFQLQQHFGVLFKWLARHLVGVLGRHSQHDPALAQIQSEALHRQVGFAARIALRDLDALEAIVADDSAPNRVVEIEDQRLAALAAQGCNGAGNVIGIKRNQFV